MAGIVQVGGIVVVVMPAAVGAGLGLEGCPNHHGVDGGALHIILAAIAGSRVMCGDSLLADNPAEVFCLLLGTGAKGKSTTLRVLSTIWGDGARNVDAPRTLLARGASSFPKRARVINRRGATKFVRSWLGIRYRSNDERREEWEWQNRREVLCQVCQGKPDLEKRCMGSGL